MINLYYILAVYRYCVEDINIGEYCRDRSTIRKIHSILVLRIELVLLLVVANKVDKYYLKRVGDSYKDMRKFNSYLLVR